MQTARTSGSSATCGRGGPYVFRALDALTVDDRRSRARLASRLLPALHEQRVMDAHQRAVVVSQVEVVVHCAACRQILGQSPPLAPCAEHVRQGIDDRSDLDRALVAALLGRRDQRCDQPPFRVRQVARVAQTASVIASPVSRPSTSAKAPSRPSLNHNMLISLNMLPNRHSGRPLPPRYPASWAGRLWRRDRCRPCRSTSLRRHCRVWLPPFSSDLRRGKRCGSGAPASRITA